MKTTTKKDLRVYAGRLEANVTALQVALDSYKPEQTNLILQVVTTKTLIEEVRGSIERLEV